MSIPSSERTQLESEYEIDPPTRHERYYIYDGNVIFLVENHLFRVHRYFFARESVVFRDMLSMPQPAGIEPEGTTDIRPIHLPQVKSEDFENFLWVFYNPEYEYSATVNKWKSVLMLAHRWQFETIKTLAIRNMEDYVTPIDRAVWAAEYDVGNDWLLKAYTALGTRGEPLSDEEGIRLGLHTVLRLSRLRERIQKRRGVASLEEPPIEYQFNPRPASPESEIAFSPRSLYFPPPNRDIEDTRAEFGL